MANSEIRKAAILLMSLPDEQAGQLLAKLTPKEVEAVSIEIARTGGISGDEQEAVIRDFATANSTGLTGRSGGLDVARRLVERALGDGAGVTLDNVRQSIEAVPFGFLQNVDSRHLLNFIIDERPQTIALVLSHLPPRQAAEIMSGLSADRQLSVIRRVATMGQTSPEIIKDVERGLEHRMSSVMSRQFENAGGVAAVAEMLNVIDRASARKLLENLAQEDPDLAEEIRCRMEDGGEITTYSDEEEEQFIRQGGGRTAERGRRAEGVSLRVDGGKAHELRPWRGPYAASRFAAQEARQRADG